MKKKLIILLVIICTLVVAVPVLAAPADVFKDVPEGNWAYGAVQQLAKAGIVEGYGDGTFRGKNTITRYEMAIIVANAMTKLDKADEQQKLLINKLSQEFNEELVQLGVRVAHLEAAQPTIKIGGQARITYGYRDDSGTDTTWGYKADRHSYTTYRWRLEGTVQPTDNLIFFGRLRAQDYDVQTGLTNAAGTPGAFSEVYAEQFWFKWSNLCKVNALSVTAGRQGLLLGKGGITYTVGNNDVIQFDYVKPDFSWKIGLYNAPSTTGDRELLTQVKTKIGPHATISVANQHQLATVPSTDSALSNNHNLNLTSVAFDYTFTPKLAFFGEYAKNTGYSDANKIYWYGLTNGSPAFHPALGLLTSVTKEGASAQALIYRRYEHNGQYIGMSQLNAALGNEKLGGVFWLDDTKGIEFYTENTLAKNLVLLNQFGQAKNIYTNMKSNYGIIQLYLFF